MNKNVLIVMTLLCSGQGYGSDRLLGEKLAAEDFLEDKDSDYGKLACPKAPKTNGFNQLSEKADPKLSLPGEALRLAGHVVKYVPMAIVGGLGGVALAKMAAPAVAGFICSNIALDQFIALTGGVGFLRGFFQGPTDYTNEKKLRLLRMGEEKNSNTKNLTNPSAQSLTDQQELKNAKSLIVQDLMSHEEIAFILSQKPADWRGADKEWISKYFEDLMFAHQNDQDKESYDSVTMSSSRSSSEVSSLETLSANRSFFEEENKKKIYAWLSTVENSSLPCTEEENHENTTTSSSAASSSSNTGSFEMAPRVN